MLTEDSKKLRNAAIKTEFKKSDLLTYDPEKKEYINVIQEPTLTDLYDSDKEAFIISLKNASKEQVSALIKTLDKQGLELVIKELFGKDIDRRKSVVSLRIQAETFLENL